MTSLNAPGANDNGTGVAALIEIARALRDASVRSRPIRLAFFVNEAAVLRYARHGQPAVRRRLAARGEPVWAMLSLETLGAFSDAPGSQTYPAPFGRVFPDRGNFVAFVGTIGSRQFLGRRSRPFAGTAMFPRWAASRRRSSRGRLVRPQELRGARHPRRHDHRHRALRYAHYHTPADTPDKVDYATLAPHARATDVVRDLAGGAAREWPRRQEPSPGRHQGRLRHSGWCREGDRQPLASANGEIGPGFASRLSPSRPTASTGTTAFWTRAAIAHQRAIAGRRRSRSKAAAPPGSARGRAPPPRP